MAELERKIGQHTVKIDFLEGCLQRIEELWMLPAWKSTIYCKFDEEVSMGWEMSIGRMADLGGVSGSAFYRLGKDAKAGADQDTDLHDAIQCIALQWPSYGRPRITRELRRYGRTVKPKRVRRLLREDNLLCVRKRKFAVTTDGRTGDSLSEFGR